MAFKKQIPIDGPSDGLRQRLLAMAEPLDPLTLKRAEFARYAIPATREFMAMSRKLRPGARTNVRLASLERTHELLKQLAGMGDPVARVMLAAARDVSRTGNAPDFSTSFTEHGFLIDTGYRIVPTPMGPMCTFGESAYGPILGTHRTSERTISIGAMLDNALRTSWTSGLPTADTTIDTHYLLLEAVEGVEAYRTNKSDFPEIRMLDPEDPRACRTKNVGISPADMERCIRTGAVDREFLKGLASGPEPEAIAGFLKVMHYHYDYTATLLRYHEDETRHVANSLNALIQDEMVRACVCASGLDEIEALASMAYGDTDRALFHMGTHLLLALNSGIDDALERVRENIMATASAVSGLDMQSATAALYWFCAESVSAIRRGARKLLRDIRDAGSGMPASLLQELKSIGRKEFVTEDVLPRLLEAYRMREEGGDDLKPLPPAVIPDGRQHRDGN